jgi:uncharacterized protein YjbJ (UPF0337 family)
MELSMANKAKRKISGALDQAKGKVKQQSGNLGTKIEGHFDEAKGKLKQESTKTPRRRGI